MLAVLRACPESLRMRRAIDLIEDALRAKGWRWARLAERTPSIDPYRYSRWRKGVGKPDADQLREIAQALGQTVGELLGEGPVRPRPLAHERQSVMREVGTAMTRLGAAVARWEAAAAAAEAAIQEMDEKPQAAITDAFPGGTTPRRNKRKNRA